MTPNAKSKTFVSKTKGFDKFAWIKSGAIVKEASKYWKEFLASTP